MKRHYKELDNLNRFERKVRGGFTRAARQVIKQHIDVVKNGNKWQGRDELDKTYICAITGYEFDSGLEIDHHPVAFRDTLFAFELAHNVNFMKVDLTIRGVWADKELCKAFFDFHVKHATLRKVNREAHRLYHLGLSTEAIQAKLL